MQLCFSRICLTSIVLLAAAANAQTTIAITEFTNRPVGGTEGNLTGEYIELYNYGASPINLQNWIIKDDDTDTFTLPSVTIQPNDYLVLARDKTFFEAIWLGGVPNAKVVDTENMALSDTSDEIVLRTPTNTEVWRLAYIDDESAGRATFLAINDFTQTNYGTKASPRIVRNGNDLIVGTLGYQSNDATADPFAYTGGRISSSTYDTGSPLRGGYGAGMPAPGPHAINLNSAGTAFNPGVRGVALADVTMERPSYSVGIPDTYNVSDGSSLRGVAGGLYADLYDWRTRVNSYHSWFTDQTQPRPPTLQFMRWARDHNANLFITANTRGLVEHDPVEIGKMRYYTSDTLTLAQLAADWVHYTNHIVQTYRQGDTITDSRDSAILNSLVWNSSHPGDNFDKLLAAAEAPVAPVTYWEIGNEPTISVSGGIGVSNGYTMNAADYYARYKAITQAMKAEDPNIKVGPCLVNGSGGNAAFVTTIAQDPDVALDFVAYHPYQTLGAQATTQDAQNYLGTVYFNQWDRWNDIRNAITAGGRNPNLVEMAATEVCVSNWSYNETQKEGEMAHAIGSVETVFTYARLGLTASHYWIWPADQDYGTPRYPLYLAYEKMRDHMGDTLLDSYVQLHNVRVYTTRDSSTGKVSVWGLNFNNAQNETVNLSLTGMSGTPTVTRHTLKATAGTTSLTSGNYNGNRGVHREEVAWVTTAMPGASLSNLSLDLEAATLTLLVIEPAADVGEWMLY